MTSPSEAQSLRDALAYWLRGQFATMRDLEAAQAKADALLSSTGPIGAHIAKVEAERDALSHRRRWNVEERHDGKLAICHGHHDRSEDCDWVEYVPADTAEAQVATLTARLAEVDAALEAERQIPKLSGKPEAWFVTQYWTDRPPTTTLIDYQPREPSYAFRERFTVEPLYAARSALSKKDAGHE